MLIHSMWIGSPMPAWIAGCLATWPVVNPDAELVVWSESMLEREMFPLTNQTLWDDPNPRQPHQFRADMVRYELLNRFGGVWVDADFEARKPIGELHRDGWASWELQDEWVNNAIMGCEPGHPVVVEAIATLPESMKARRGSTNTRISGPQFFTPLALKHDLTIYPQAWFYPYSWSEVRRIPLKLGRKWDDDPYAVHHWHNRRRG